VLHSQRLQRKACVERAYPQRRRRRGTLSRHLQVVYSPERQRSPAATSESVALAGGSWPWRSASGPSDVVPCAVLPADAPIVPTGTKPRTRWTYGRQIAAHVPASRPVASRAPPRLSPLSTSTLYREHKTGCALPLGPRHGRSRSCSCGSVLICRRPVVKWAWSTVPVGAAIMGKQPAVLASGDDNPPHPLTVAATHSGTRSRSMVRRTRGLTLSRGTTSTGTQIGPATPG